VSGRRVPERRAGYREGPWTESNVYSYSLNPKFTAGKRYKLYSNFTFCFSFWKSPGAQASILPGLCPWTPQEDFRTQAFRFILFQTVPECTPCKLLHCKILGTPMYPTMCRAECVRRGWSDLLELTRQRSARSRSQHRQLWSPRPYA